MGHFVELSASTAWNSDDEDDAGIDDNGDESSLFSTSFSVYAKPMLPRLSSTKRLATSSRGWCRSVSGEMMRPGGLTVGLIQGLDAGSKKLLYD